MCGIAGAVADSSFDVQRVTGAMCDQMIARGPDDSGVIAGMLGKNAVALGNRRLAVIDPTPDGHQPMIDESRGTSIVFNGTIYNYRELRDELARDGERFASDCDTEVVLKAYGRYGARCVERLRGMFAFAIHDPARGELFLARDRLGIKPLYYFHADARQNGASFMFASQVRALLSTNAIPPTLSRDAVRSYLAYGAVSEPLTAIEGIRALPAGHTATLRDGTLTLARYWSIGDIAPRSIDRADAVSELRARLDESVRAHLVSDVPLGVFLSGGIDSSVLAALASRHSDRVRTVSVAFDDPVFSEAPNMEMVAQHVGSDHTRVTLRAGDLRADLGDAFAAMDQPTFDGINTYIVSRAAAGAGLKVALSGLGADELFDGYGHAGRIAVLDTLRRLPAPVRSLLGRGAAVAASNGNREKLAAWLSGTAGNDAHDLLRRLYLPDDVARLTGRALPTDGAATHTNTSARDLDTYTKTVLLRDTDAMSMAHSLEVRVPYLDNTLAEWALSLPPSVRGRGKSLLVDATRDLLPAAIFERRKQGFVLPLARWMREELRDDVESTLRHPPEAIGVLLREDAMADVWNEFAHDGRRWLRPWSLYALCRWTESVTQQQTVEVAA